MTFREFWNDKDKLTKVLHRVITVMKAISLGCIVLMMLMAILFSLNIITSQMMVIHVVMILMVVGAIIPFTTVFVLAFRVLQLSPRC